MDSIELSFGSQQRWQLNYGGQLVDWNKCGVRSVANLDEKIKSGMSTPIDFPAIELAIIPGDQVVVVVEPLVPQMTQVVAACLKYLLAHGAEATQIAVVLASHTQEDVASLRKALAPVAGEAIEIELHDPDDHTKVAYVAANEQSDPIYMNRRLVDADFVLPVTCGRGSTVLDYLGAYSIFPLLSDRTTRGRFFDLEKLVASREHRKLTAWADEAAWWVGLMVVVQVIPADHQQIAEVLIGNPVAVEARVQEIMKSAWGMEPTSAELVIALIEGDQSQQNWENIARVVHTAQQLVEPQGAIVICSDIQLSPGRGLQRVMRVQRGEGNSSKQFHDPADDGLAAAVLLDAAKECHIYLVSGLSESTVESLGLATIKDSVQLEHLMQQFGSCAVLGSAQYRFVVANEGFGRESVQPERHS